MKQSWNYVISAALIAMFMSGSAQAAPALAVSAVSGSPFDTAAVTETLNGNGMAGMTVTACLVSGACQTSTWVGGGGTKGGATGTNWSLGLNGDSFTSKFIFAGSGGWKSLTINTRGGLAAFDWMDSINVGSPGSALGVPFTLDVFNSGAVPDTQYSISAQYSDILYVGGQVYNDLYTVLTINISNPSSGLGLTGSMEFFADTDRTAAISARQPPSGVPVPATLALVGLGLAGIALSRRRPADRG